MKQFVHVTVADLAQYRAHKKSLDMEKAPTFDRVYSMYGLKKWITGLGELTPAGKDLLAKWDGLGNADEITRTLRDELRWVIKGHEGESRKMAKLRDYKLINGSNEATERGRTLLELFAGEDGAK